MRYLKYLLLIVFILSFCCIYAQKESKTVKDSISLCIQCDSLYNRICPDNGIYGHPEHLGGFPGGVEELINFLRNNIQYPTECKDKKIEGRVYIKFIIDEKGEIICPYILKSLHPKLDEEALRIVKLMPNWEPASNNGVPYKICFSFPIDFKL